MSPQKAISEFFNSLPTTTSDFIKVKVLLTMHLIMSDRSYGHYALNNIIEFQSCKTQNIKRITNNYLTYL